MRTGILARDPQQDGVTPLELFFDLMWVFALGQHSHVLLANPTWPGAAETAVLYLATFRAWAYTAWTGSLVDTARAPVMWMLLVVMLIGFFMNASIPTAFEGAGWVFVAAYLAIQIGRTAWLLTVGLVPTVHEHFQRTLVWMLATSPLWIADASAGHENRLLLWGIAAAVDLVGLLMAHPLPGRWLHTIRGDRHGVEALMVMIAGLIAIAVGDELVIAHPTDQTDLTTNLMLYGGPAFFLAAQGWYLRSEVRYLRSEVRYLPRLRLAGIVALAIVSAITLTTPSFVAAIGATTVLVAIAIADGRLSGLGAALAANADDRT